MAEKLRLKRIDKIGATADIPYSRTITDFKAQRWIANRFFRLMGGRGAFFWENPEEHLGMSVVKGSNYFDLKETGSRIKCMEQAPKETIRTARQLEKLGRKEEGAGHYETAIDFYYRACLLYVSAAWGIFDSDNEELIWLTERIRDTGDRVIKYSPSPMERVEIPFEGKSIPGILSLTPSRKKAPTVLFVPGMDLHKENGINLLQNPFVSRGMNSLVIDGPGQGESLMRKIWVDEENYGRAGKAAIDYLVKRPEVDAQRIGIHGVSMGTYWGPLIAIHDSRVKAVAAHMSAQTNKDTPFNAESPNFKFRCMWMTGNLSEEKFDKVAAKMTLKGRESKIKCPHIIFHGEFDLLATTEEVYAYFNRLGSKIKELRIYENQFHGIYRFWDDIMNMSADWLRERLNGIPPKQNRKVVLVDWNRNEIPVDEGKIAKGFSYITAEEV